MASAECFADLAKGVAMALAVLVTVDLQGYRHALVAEDELRIACRDAQVFSRVAAVIARHTVLVLAALAICALPPPNCTTAPIPQAPPPV